MALLDKATVLAWVAGHEIAAAASRECIRKEGPRPAEALAAFDELIRYWQSLHGWPPPEDRLRLEQAEALRERWTSLRERFHG